MQTFSSQEPMQKSTVTGIRIEVKTLCPWRKGRKTFWTQHLTPVLSRDLLPLEKGQAPDNRGLSYITDMRALLKAANETETLKNLLQHPIFAFGTQ